MSSPGKKLWILSTLLILVIALSQCIDDSSTTLPRQTYLNHADSVEYVGIQTCRQCHAEIYDSFIETGMGASFHEALPMYSAGDFNNAVLADTVLNLNYQPFWKNDSLWLREFRFKDADTLYNQLRKIDYIVGSGQHTNSHMLLTGGYLHQAPFTWYAQAGKLDLPPGFENGANSRFSRKIGLECTSCHNSMPVGFQKGSVNKYSVVPGAIDCERCHGPGELHVKQMMAGDIVDTANEIDYSIVNVGKLTPDLQFEVCQRCHLQGNPVLKPGRSFFDFKPGMHLNEVMDVYLPRYSDADDDFIMASHADRFKQSACTLDNRQFNCTSCHNPHRSVKLSKAESFNKVCGNCHLPAPRHQCTTSEEDLEKANYNCVSCHMPMSTSTDIPHVSIHDHRIQIPGEKPGGKKLRKFMELAAVNNPHPSARSKTMAYLQQYERFGGKEFMLDSAYYFLEKLEDTEDALKLRVHYYFLKEDYAEVTKLVDRKGVSQVLGILDSMSYDNSDAWTAYRISESYKNLGKLDLADTFLYRAIHIMPYNPDLLNKYGSIKLREGDREGAETFFRNALVEYGRHPEALNNLGYIYLIQGNFSEAKSYFRRALLQDPDYELAWLNFASVCVQMDEWQEAEGALEQALRINPKNQRAAMMYMELKREM